MQPFRTGKYSGNLASGRTWIGSAYRHGERVWITVLPVSTVKFVASIFVFAALLLAVLYLPAYLFLGGPAIAWWIMVIPALLFGLTVTAALDDPLKRAAS